MENENLEEAETCGSATLTVAANGKISGKILEGGRTWTLSAPYFDSPFTATVIGKAGKEAFTNEVEVAEGAAGGVASSLIPHPSSLIPHPSSLPSSSLFPLPSSLSLAAWQYNWKVEPGKSLAKEFNKRTLTYAILADGTFSEDEAVLSSALGADVTGRVTLKFSANGTASVAGEFVSGYDEKKGKYKTVKASGSATLVQTDEDVFAVFVYLAPKGLEPHARCLEL